MGSPRAVAVSSLRGPVSSSWVCSKSAQTALQQEKLSSYAMASSSVGKSGLGQQGAQKLHLH